MTDWNLRPARDIELPLAARLRSHSRENGWLGMTVGALWRGVSRTYLALAHRLEIDGTEHLPAEPPCVFVCNHASHLDTLSLTAALPGRLARHAVALAAANVFFGTVASSAFAAMALNALPVWRGRTSRDDLGYLRTRLIEDGLVFILFPEGTRSRDGVIGEFRPGLGALVAGSGVPVIPCYLEGAYRCWPATRSLPRPGKLRLRIGAALSFADVPNDRDGWKRVAASAESAVRELAN